MEEENRNIIELTDEEGNAVPFEHLMTLRHEGNDYVVLEAVRDMEDCMEGEAVILKTIRDENGEDVYATVDDEKELTAVFAKCVAAIEEQDSLDGDASDEDDEEE